MSKRCSHNRRENRQNWGKKTRRIGSKCSPCQHLPNNLVKCPKKEKFKFRGRAENCKDLCTCGGRNKDRAPGRTQDTPPNKSVPGEKRGEKTARKAKTQMLHSCPDREWVGGEKKERRETDHATGGRSLGMLEQQEG